MFMGEKFYKNLSMVLRIDFHGSKFCDPCYITDDTIPTQLVDVFHCLVKHE